MGEFFCSAGVQQSYTSVTRKFICIFQIPLLQNTLCDILNHKARHVYRVFGGGIRRCVGQIQILQFRGFHSCANSGSQYINALKTIIAAFNWNDWDNPDSGTIEIGQTVKLGYFSQENEDMDTSLKVIDYIKNVAEYVKTKDGSISASQMLERFLFPPSVQYTVIEKLSGGERRRLYLLKILMSAPNVLILDEPTNDLDIQTLMILEDYLDSFQGIVITVSHDRYFLDRVVGRIFAFEGDGKLQQYEGGFTDYQAAKAEREAKLAESAAENPAAAKKSADKGNDAAETDSASRGNAKPREKKLKFSYKEQREWDTIEDDIAALEEAVENLEKEIEASATNFTKLNELMKEKEEKEVQLEEKMDRWVYLNDLAEQIEAQKNR